MAHFVQAAPMLSPSGETPSAAYTALSGVAGSISLTAWICVLVPQLIKNYKAQSAEALSMAFMCAWLLGDVANISGAFFADLAPTALAIAVYFIFADLILICQCLYYNTKNARQASRRRRRHSSHISTDSENAPLLGERRWSSSSAHAAAAANPGMDSLGKIIAGDDYEQGGMSWWQNVLGILAVHVVGVAAWLVSYMTGVWDDDGAIVEPPRTDDTAHTVGMVLGYMSAALYLCARIPQIIKNWRDKSCEGLALLFFLLSVTGNMAYSISIIAYNPSKEQLVKSLPWLAGALGTIVQDIIIFAQFRIYASNKRQNPSNGAVLCN